ncbi:MAG: twin-arginine translocation signal domain-containing protein [Euzebyales bacterium]|nr:twin-arginine translocation signal domain-containing protein [Euzebyales bacterium]
MDRRDVLKMGAYGAAAAGLAACTSSAVSGDGASEGNDVALSDEVAGDQSLPEIQWEMATSWPVGLDTIYGGATVFAERVAALTGNRFKITPRAAGELVDGLEVLPSVQEGGVKAGHTASYYYTGLTPAVAFGTALPFGLTARQQNSWLYEGGGLKLLQDMYADRFNMIQFPAGNTGVQMGGWFNREINSVGDLKGLSMRIPGLGGEVMSRLGVTVQVIAGGEIFQALDTGGIDAAEFVGPYDDEKLGFQNAAKFYYYPGWWEPGPTLEVQFNLDDWNELPEPYQEVIKSAAQHSNATMMAKYDAVNPPALQRIMDSKIELRQFPDDMLKAAEERSFELFDEFAQKDADFKSILGEWSKFRDGIQSWFALGERSMLNIGGGPAPKGGG